MLKMISVEISEQCIMEPNCPFCYVKDIQKLKTADGYLNSWKWKIGGIIEKSRTPPNEITVCIEYNGYNIREIRDAFFIPKETHVTMTTMPMIVSDTFAGFIKAQRIEAIALSYDEFKCESPMQWAEKAEILRKHGFKVSCNYLLTKNGLQHLFMHFNNDEPSFIEPIIRATDQLNLLSMKPTGAYDDITLKALAISIQKLQTELPTTLDNCLGVQLGYTNKCHAGDEFIHLLSDGTVVSCCFQDKCFLW